MADAKLDSALDMMRRMPPSAVRQIFAVAALENQHTAGTEAKKNPAKRGGVIITPKG